MAIVAAPAIAQDTPADVTAACATASNMPQALCACIGERSAHALSAEQRAFTVAALNGDDAETARLRATMDPMALVEAATFIRTSPSTCVR
jgi:saccharopine dehydrogenase-like NADP-dependent oxidoreductase